MVPVTCIGAYGSEEYGSGGSRCSSLWPAVVARGEEGAAVVLWYRAPFPAMPLAESASCGWYVLSDPSIR